MAEASVIKGGNGSAVLGREGGKSINMIRAQWDRIQDAFRTAYYKAENGDYRNLDAELERLNRRLNTVNQTAQRYESNISEQPEYQRITEERRRTFREGGRSPQEARETARIINSLKERRNSLMYPRSVYMGRKTNRR